MYEIFCMKFLTEAEITKSDGLALPIIVSSEEKQR